MLEPWGMAQRVQVHQLHDAVASASTASDAGAAAVAAQPNTPPQAVVVGAPASVDCHQHKDLVLWCLCCECLVHSFVRVSAGDSRVSGVSWVHNLSYMTHEVGFSIHDLCFMVNGSCFMVHGSVFMVHDKCIHD